MPNVYYNPEKFDLEIVACLDEDNLSYEYNTFIVLCHRPSGRLFYADDQGCSCPTPFENYHFKGPDDTNLTEINPDNFDPFVTEFENWCKGAKIKSDEMDDVIKSVKGR